MKDFPAEIEHHRSCSAARQAPYVKVRRLCLFCNPFYITAGAEEKGRQLPQQIRFIRLVHGLLCYTPLGSKIPYTEGSGLLSIFLNYLDCLGLQGASSMHTNDLFGCPVTKVSRLEAKPGNHSSHNPKRRNIHTEFQGSRCPETTTSVEARDLPCYGIALQARLSLPTKSSEARYYASHILAGDAAAYLSRSTVPVVCRTTRT